MMTQSCPVCNKSLSGLRSDAKYCSNVCKNRAYLDRHSIQTKQPQEERECANRRCDNLVQNRRANAKFCSSHCRKMESHWTREAKIKALIKLLQK